MIVVLGFSVFVLSLSLVRALSRIKALRREVQRSEASIQEEILKRRDYEIAMGISVWDDEATEKDLWARASQGDEFAEKVLASRIKHSADLMAERQ